MYSNENKLKIVSRLDNSDIELNQIHRLYNKILEKSPYDKYFSYILLDNLNKSFDYKRLYAGGR